VETPVSLTFRLENAQAVIKAALLATVQAATALNVQANITLLKTKMPVFLSAPMAII